MSSDVNAPSISPSSSHRSVAVVSTDALVSKKSDKSFTQTPLHESRTEANISPVLESAKSSEDRQQRERLKAIRKKNLIPSSSSRRTARFLLKEILETHDPEEDILDKDKVGVVKIQPEVLPRGVVSQRLRYNDNL